MREKTSMMYRHGDVLLRRVERVPYGAVALDHCVLARGETTGHSHTVPSGAIQYIHEQQQYLDVIGKTADLAHQEHLTISLPRGAYRVIRQREYTPAANRAVRD